MIRRITSLQHPIVKHLVKLRQNSDYRKSCQALIVEGIKPISEVCKEHHTKLLITSDENLIPKEVKPDEIILADEAVLKKISGMVHSEGIIAEVAMPKNSSLEGLQRIVVLDCINDPGNLGSLLRSALALGWDGAFIVGQGCDLYNEKALRAARGANFRLPIRHGSWEELKILTKKNQLTPLAASLEGTAIHDFKTEKGVLLVLSNEASGLSESAERFCEKVTIPISGKMESLNVAAAGAIAMYTINCRR